MHIEDAAREIAAAVPHRRIISRDEAETVSDGWLEEIPGGTFFHFPEDDAVVVETCASDLLKTSRGGQGWDQDEFTRAVFLFLCGAFEAPVPETPADVQQGLERLLGSGPVLVAMPLANVVWEGGPHATKDFVIGIASHEWTEAVVAHRAERPGLPTPVKGVWWLDPTRSHWQRGTVPLFATWITGKRGQRAVTAAIERFDELVSLCLLADEHPEGRGLYSGRGASHRPGARGLTVDRPNLMRLVDSDNADAIGVVWADILVGDEFGGGIHRHWYGEDPFPLEQLLNGEFQSKMLSHLTTDSNVGHRFRTAARWYGKAHWAESSEDHMLALGIAIDALLGEQSGVPGREIADRFALLGPPRERPERARRMNKIYKARSAVAHGGTPSVVEDVHFLRGVECDVRWCARALHEVSLTRHAKTAKDIQKLFADLKWGLT